MNTRCTACLMALYLAPTLALAEEAAKPPPPPPPKWYDTFEVHGVVDVFYSANLGQAQETGNRLRVFDAANGFQLSYAKLTAQLAPTGACTAGFRADLGFGPTANVLNTATAGSSGRVSDVDLQQAFVSVKLPHDLVLDGGKFVTATGAEVIEAKDDWLYSRSLLFGFAIPFTHTGVRATMPIPGAPGLSVMASLFNGFDNPPLPVGPKKMAHLALLYSGPSSTSVTLNVLYGYAAASDRDTRVLLDGVIARSFGDLSLNVNADFSKRGSLSYWGISGMARYSLMGDRVRLSARGEILDDGDGFAVVGGLGNTYYEGTLGVSFPVGASAELRLEGRRDHSDKPVFKASTDEDQTTIQVAALAWF